MSNNRWQQLQQLFDDAVSRPADSRAAFLESACRGDPALRAEVEALLQHDEEASPDFLHPPEPPPSEPSDEPDPLIGMTIDQYHIRRIIGTGGMGRVYEAEQQNPKRLVALKIMAVGFPTRSQHRSFEREKNTLARLQHPHIAQIHHAGTHSDGFGRKLPFFVMEYVREARPITTYAREEKLGTRERLNLFKQVCDAVQHGHDNGIIHRDLKPANILVDQSGRVKVIDFGIARVTDSDRAVTTIQTGVGAFVGTVQYMSPEQCTQDARELDRRSDVYALGVLLYELLTGQMPYDLTCRLVPAMTRIICDDPPIPPSTVNRFVRGDLEVIILKALEKDRAKRYQSVEALADDIDRYLRHEPIMARPRSRRTKMIHWATRHPKATTGIASLIIALGIVGGTWTATWLINFRPWKVVVTEDMSAAFLVTVSGHHLHEWPSKPYGIRAIEKLLTPATGPNRRLAVIGYARKDTGPYRNRLCVYDVDGDRRKPLWASALEPSDLPAFLVDERGFKIDEFWTHQVHTMNIFPELPGKEIVAAHQHHHATSTALRVYSLDGTVLYQVWLDNIVDAAHWLSGPRQLVITGLNGRGFWHQRDYAGLTPSFDHPRVIFAIRPKLGLRTNSYVVEEPGDGPLEPAWYRTIGGPEHHRLIKEPTLWKPRAVADQGHLVELNIRVAQKGAEGGFTILIDQHGNEVPGSRRHSDDYALNMDRLPPLDAIQLQDLQPTTVDIPYGSPSKP